MAAVGASNSLLRTALQAELRAIWIVKLALSTFHVELFNQVRGSTIADAEHDVIVWAPPRGIQYVVPYIAQVITFERRTAQALALRANPEPVRDSIFPS